MEFEIISQISGIEIIAAGSKIRILPFQRRKFGSGVSFHANVFIAADRRGAVNPENEGRRAENRNPGRLLNIATVNRGRRRLFPEIQTPCRVHPKPRIK